MKKIKSLALISLSVFLPFIARAESEPVTLINPLGSDDVRVIIATIIKGALSISGSIALLMFIYGGILWLTSMGKPEGVKKGKDILIWTTLGIVLIASAYLVTTAIFNAVMTGDVSGGA